ncbi:MAG: glycosyl hydrolase family 32 [Anaerolineae bacterium]|nr:glycosyl hydrolase family 32 [Anaerolineae bacterium]
MTLRLPDKWLWDFWFAQDGPDYHVFYLQAPRSLIDPELRHWNVSIGHAISQDLRNWTVLPDALAPSPTPAWDDKSTWTGSIIKHQGLWHMLYTGTSQAENGYIQRIGLATSKDLIHWQKHPDNPRIEADPTWYEMLDLAKWEDQSWRDPWVFQHSQTGAFYALITARVNHGPIDGRGVIAYARSTDLIQWQVMPPLTKPGDFGKLEVPQLVEIKGRYYLLFCTLSHTTAVQRLSRTGLPPVTGTHYLMADNPLGPFHYPTDHFLVGDELGSLFAGKLIQEPNGPWIFMAWRNVSATRQFLGELSDPYPVEIDQMGNLMVSWGS